LVDYKGIGAISILAERLKQARLTVGLSQKELGVKAGIDVSSASPRMNQYETGKHSPDFMTCKRLCDVLDIPVAFLYAESSELAELIKVHHSLNNKQRGELVKSARKLSGGN